MTASPTPPDFFAKNANKSEHHADSAYCSDHIGDEKQCRKCQRLLPGSHFRLKGRSKTKISDRCVDCQGSPAATWNARNPDAAREAVLRFRENGGERRGRLKSQYGLTATQFSELLRSQQGKCAICFAEEPGGRWKHFHVDHDHSTGKVRGLLCTNCNRGIGYMADDPERLKRAADYITDDANKMVSAGLPSEEMIARTLCITQGNNPDFDYDPNGISDAPGTNLCWKLYLGQARAILDLIRPAFEQAERYREFAHAVFGYSAPDDDTERMMKGVIAREIAPPWPLSEVMDWMGLVPASRALSAEAKLAQAVEDEREACAATVEDMAAEHAVSPDIERHVIAAHDFSRAATAIRARSAAARGEKT